MQERNEGRLMENKHYSEEYFSWQREIGEFGGKANKIKFEEFIEPDSFVVDFGAGGGFLIESLDCGRRLGVEINPSARKEAESRGIPMVDQLEKIESCVADLVITHHALEHTDEPLRHMREIHRILKPGGKVVCVVPCESISYGYIENDINFYLYSWSPMCLGNLAVRAGFRVIESKPFLHKWPPFFYRIQKLTGWPLFHLLCRIWARVERKFFQVRCVAIKPQNEGSV